MKLEPGMRVRCVDASFSECLKEGAEYTVLRNLLTPDWVLIKGAHPSEPVGYPARRFKPVVRVKAKCVPSLSVIVKRAVAAYNRMTPGEKESMHKAQRESWVRGEMALGAD